MRYKYLEAVLRQEVGFFDSQEATTSEVINSISKDTFLIQEVLSEKVHNQLIDPHYWTSTNLFLYLDHYQISVIISYNIYQQKMFYSLLSFLSFPFLLHHYIL